jgi:hypothetical protein
MSDFVVEAPLVVLEFGQKSTEARSVLVKALVHYIVRWRGYNRLVLLMNHRCHLLCEKLLLLVEKARKRPIEPMT